jgi:hypothetical protein
MAQKLKTQKARPPKDVIAAEVEKAVPVRPQDLFLDPKNPRLLDSNFKLKDQDQILERLWTEFNVSEITNSIVASECFWQHEPLIAAREDGKLVVIEGNRRLAAVQLLLSPERQGRIGATGVPEISKKLRANLAGLPVIEKPRREVWDFIGFKHVNGPQEWDSIAKAQYIARIHEDYEVPLPDIATAIGDRNATVERLYHGLKVLQQAQNAGVFDPADRFHQRKDFAYSHLWTGLGYEGVRAFLGMADREKSEREPVPKGKISALGELCRWLYGSHEADVEPLVKSQNPHLRQLDEALRFPRGVAALRRNLSLQQAVNAARGDTRLLLDALIAAEQNLREAKGYFSTGFNGQQDVGDTIKNIHALASSLNADLEAARPKSK